VIDNIEHHGHVVAGVLLQDLQFLRGGGEIKRLAGLALFGALPAWPGQPLHHGDASLRFPCGYLEHCSGRVERCRQRACECGGLRTVTAFERNERPAVALGQDDLMDLSVEGVVERQRTGVSIVLDFD